VQERVVEAYVATRTEIQWRLKSDDPSIAVREDNFRTIVSIKQSVDKLGFVLENCKISSRSRNLKIRLYRTKTLECLPC